MDSTSPPQLQGVVIITLPPADNPSKGKTITSIFTLSNPNTPSPLSIPQQQQPPQHHQTFSFKSFFNTPRKALGLLSLSLLAILLFTSFSSSNTLYELRNSNNEDDDQKIDSFVFKLYPKMSVSEKVGKDVEFKLGRVVQRDVVENGMMLNDGVGTKEISKRGSLISSSALSADSSTVFPVKGNVYPSGLYYVSILVGNPPRPYHLDMDTGSDLTWIQCDAPCTSCAKGPHPLYKPTKKGIVTSKDSLCKELDSNQKHGYCESCQQCDYEIEYADHSSSMGILARDELQLMIANGTLSKPKFVFGCAYDQQGQLSVSPARTDGILGLNGAKIGLPSQLASQGIIRNVVGHCIARDEDNNGYMFLGDDFLPQWGMTWVPMLSSTDIKAYHAKILRVSYGSEQLNLGRIDNCIARDEDNNGYMFLGDDFLPQWGMTWVPMLSSTDIKAYHAKILRVSYGSEQLNLGRIDNNAQRVIFDTGSSYTYFTQEAYSGFVASLEGSLPDGLVQDESDTTLPLCWRAEFPIRSVKDVKAFFKPLSLHFGSKWLIMSTKLLIPPEGYLITSNKGNVCLGILDGSDIHDGSTIILGDISLRGQLIAYDNINQKIGWMQSNCAKPQRYESLPFFF